MRLTGAWCEWCAGRHADARALCRACGQPWRAASLGGPAGEWGPLPVGVAAARLEEESSPEVQVRGKGRGKGFDDTWESKPSAFRQARWRVACCARRQVEELAAEVELGGPAAPRALWKWSCLQVALQASRSNHTAGEDDEDKGGCPCPCPRPSGPLGGLRRPRPHTPSSCQGRPKLRQAAMATARALTLAGVCRAPPCPCRRPVRGGAVRPPGLAPALAAAALPFLARPVLGAVPHLARPGGGGGARRRAATPPPGRGGAAGPGGGGRRGAAAGAAGEFPSGWQSGVAMVCQRRKEWRAVLCAAHAAAGRRGRR